MMKAELGLLPLSHGSLTVLGKPAGEMNKRIGYVPQSYVPTSIPISPPSSRCYWD